MLLLGGEPRWRLVATHTARVRCVGLVLTLAVEVLLVGIGYQFYSTVRTLVVGQKRLAVAHGTALLQFEQRLHLAWEQPVQHAALRLPRLIALADAAYVYLYLPFIALTALLLFLRDRELYALARRTFLLSGAIGLIVFALFPDAPPRLLPDAGFVDTIARFDSQAGYAHNPLANQFAALPSFHFAWCTAAALFLRQSIAWRPLRAPLLLAPPLMLATIVLTANHLWIDALAGGVVVLVAARIAASWPATRARLGRQVVMLFGRRHAAIAATTRGDDTPLLRTRLSPIGERVPDRDRRRLRR
jgi:hypothetical protein